LIFENREDHNDLRNVYNPDKHQHSLGDYFMKNGIAANATAENITVTPE